MKYNFDNTPTRKNTNSIKWDLYQENVLPMWIADMDFPSAPEIISYLKETAEFGIFGYNNPPKELYESIIERMKTLFNWDVKKEWITFLPGLVCALTLACQSKGKDGDKILMFTPVYPPFLKAPSVARRQKVELPFSLNETKTDWVLDFNLIEETIIKENVQTLLLCNPHNPLGKIFSTKELNSLLAICEKHQVMIASDEIHNEIIMNHNKQHTCIAKLSSYARDNSITLMSPSKIFNLPGLCCSFAIIPNLEIKTSFERAGAYLVPHPGIFGYAGSYAAYKFGNPWKAELLTYLRKNLELCISRLVKIPNIFILKPDATYLLWIDVRELHLKQPGKYFESQGLGLSDGLHFKGNGFVRLNFATSREILEKGLELFEKAVKNI